MAVSESRVLEALKTVDEPYSGKNLVEAKAIRALEIQGGRVSFSFVAASYSCPNKAAVMDQARAALLSLEGVDEAEVSFVVDVPIQSSFKQQLPPGVRNIIAVSSAKGGVGKSTVSVNLACALAQAGDRVGLLDCDVYGPSIPTMFGKAGARPEARNGRIIPIEAHGVKIMSIGFLSGDMDEAMIWRGALVSGAIMQFFRDIDWGEIDYLILDLPPGTGDAQLTIAQQTPVIGAVVVTTPQGVALSDVRRGIAMFSKVNIDVIGVIENMSFFNCPKCQTRADIFSSGGGRRAAQSLGLPFLGEIPINVDIPRSGDGGVPIVVGMPDSDYAMQFKKIAGEMVANVATACLAEEISMPASFVGPGGS